MNNETKCHAFWKTGRNPITMKRCKEEKYLHQSNKSPEQEYQTKLRREVVLDNRKGFQFNNQ
tara:strand:+ start:3785 stop:3970 length:186 start_codon:yes stop_codon:yes gene_type:complete